MKDKEKKKKCHCNENEECQCGDECECGEDCTCGEECHCHHEEKQHECHREHCHCHEECDCEDECDENCDCDCHDHERADGYLMMAQRLQADFDNYRKHVAEQLDYQRKEGVKSVIEAFLPCLDTFREAKKTISDEKVLAGVEMIEEKILNTLKNLNVEKIEAIGQPFDHNLHEAIAYFKDESKEENIVLEEYQAGYKYEGKVIRYSKVIINKID